MAAEEEGLALARWRTRFVAPAAEADYREWSVAASVPFNRLGCALALGIWTTAEAIVVIARVPGALVFTLLVGAMVLPTIVFALVATYRRSLLPWSQPLACFANFLAGVLAASFPNWLVVHHPGYGPVETLLAWALLSNFYGFAILRAPPWQSVAAVAPYMVLAGVLDVAFVARSAVNVAFDVFLLVFGLSTGLFVNVAFDVRSREAFRQGRIIEAQKRTIARERARSEAILKQELGHQVAERSRELGALLARGDAPFAPLDMSPGARFGARYKVVRALGEGGMGAVYEVERLTDGERLALKVVTGALSRASLVRFAREAEIGARLRHENLVSIVDVGITPTGGPFLVMELVRGNSLDTQGERYGRTAWALSVLRQVARGVEALHDAGIVHRDLKPANILLSGDDDAPLARISDFGISRFDDTDAPVDSHAPTADGRAQAALTGTGALIGTPLYMAPETAEGRRVDSAADVFAFGIVAYEVLTGQVPFAMPAVMLAMSKQPVPKPSPIVTVEPAIAEIVGACLQSTPGDRPRIGDVVARLG